VVSSTTLEYGVIRELKLHVRKAEYTGAMKRMCLFCHMCPALAIMHFTYIS
jgi:hypothetical protein